jgi:hypothetical protein
MNKIPVSFEYNGKQLVGEFSEVGGSGGSTWHLLIDKYYKGSLMIIQDKWVFHSQTREMEDLADYFGSVLIAWYQ